MLFRSFGTFLGRGLRLTDKVAVVTGAAGGVGKVRTRAQDTRPVL